MKTVPPAIVDGREAYVMHLSPYWARLAKRYLRRFPIQPWERLSWWDLGQWNS